MNLTFSFCICACLSVCARTFDLIELNVTSLCSYILEETEQPDANITFVEFNLFHFIYSLFTKSTWSRQYRVAPQNGTVDFQDFALINSYLFSPCWIEHLFLIIYIYNTKIIKFSWELLILWVISYGLPFSGFARFPEFRGTVNDSFGRP